MTQPFSKALVVDDSRMARATLTKLLNKRGIDVDTAASGTDALAYMDANAAPDVVFMDYTMPDFDGLETVRRIRERHGDVAPMAMYTGHDEAEDRERAHQLGIDAFLTKPASDELLGEILEGFAEAAAADAATPSTTTADDETLPPAAGPQDGLTAPEHSAVTASTVAPPPDATMGEVAASDERPGDTETVTPITEPEPPSNPEASEDGRETTDEALTTAREAALVAAEAVAISAAEQKAREIADSVAREAAEPIAREAGTNAAREAMGKIREDVKGQIKELLESETFSQRVTDVFVRTAWPSVRAQITGEVTELLRDEVRHIARQATAADGGRPVDEATRQAKQMVKERTNELHKVVNRDMAQSARQIEARLTRLIIGVGGGLGVAIVLGFGYLLLFG